MSRGARTGSGKNQTKKQSGGVKKVNQNNTGAFKRNRGRVNKPKPSNALSSIEAARRNLEAMKLVV